MARSSAAPPLRMPDGARLTVIRRRGQRQPARQQGGPDPVAGLAAHGVGRADDGEAGQAGGHVDLDDDGHGRRRPSREAEGMVASTVALLDRDRGREPRTEAAGGPAGGRAATTERAPSPGYRPTASAPTGEQVLAALRPPV